MTDDTIGPVVVGVSGGPNSIAAATWACAVASRWGAAVQLIHSLPTTGHFMSDAAVVAIRATAGEEQRHAAQLILDGAKSHVGQHFPDLEVSVAVVSEPADDALVRASGDATLVVVGCDDVNPVAALLVGATSLSVATHATCPVAVWRNVTEPDDRPIVVGVDDTPAGAAALAAAFDFAARFGAPVRAVHAWSINKAVDWPALPMLLDWDAIADAETNALEYALAPWRTRYPDVAVDCIVEEGKPGAALLQHSDGAQLAVVGNHWRSTIASVALASTSLHLLHHSTIPVLVCHATG